MISFWCHPVAPALEAVMLLSGLVSGVLEAVALYGNWVLNGKQGYKWMFEYRLYKFTPISETAMFVFWALLIVSFLLRPYCE